MVAAARTRENARAGGRMADDGLLEAIRALHLAHPELGPKPLLAKLRAQQPDLAAGNKEVREALAALKAEESKATEAAAAPPAAAPPALPPALPRRRCAGVLAAPRRCCAIAFAQRSPSSFSEASRARPSRFGLASAAARMGSKPSGNSWVREIPRPRRARDKETNSASCSAAARESLLVPRWRRES